MAWSNYANPYMNPMANPYGMQNGFQNPMAPVMTGSQPMQTAMQQPSNGLIRVTGIDGAKAYQMPPNSVAALFDDSYDIMYVKSTDGAGFPTIRVFDFYEHKAETVLQQNSVNSENFATRQELQTLQQEIEQVKEMLSNGKQSVPEQQPATANEPNRSRR